MNKFVTSLFSKNPFIYEQKKINCPKHYALLLATMLFQQCREDDFNWDNPDIPFAFTTHLQGTVVDEQQLPIPNTTVTHLDYTTNTDQNGFFQFDKAYVVRGRAHVQVEKNSFFTNCYPLTPMIRNLLPFR